jgi:hypothetical protein
MYTDICPRNFFEEAYDLGKYRIGRGGFIMHNGLESRQFGFGRRPFGFGRRPFGLGGFPLGFLGGLAAGALISSPPYYPYYPPYPYYPYYPYYSYYPYYPYGY